MKIRYTFRAFLITSLLYVPLFTHADFVVPPHVDPTFENIQHLGTEFQLVTSSSTIIDKGSIGIPIGTSVSISYTFTHGSLWPNPNLSAESEDQAFAETVKESKIYLDLWEGVPFTSTAHIVQSWEVTNATSGTITANFPKPDSYFLVVSIPSSFYQDPQASCPDDPDWQTDCAPPYTLEQMETYYSSSILTESDPFPYAPDAFGGLQFTIPQTAAPTGISNVLFIPGIEGSRLYRRGALGIEIGLWEPSLFSRLLNLELNPDGSSKYQIYTRDLVDYKYHLQALGDVYGPFEKFMDGLVAKGTLQKWQAFPYDWRYDVQDIVTNGTLVGNATGPITKVYAQDVLQNLASSSPTGKVTIIAHSNGGLLAKALAIELQKENKLNLIDHIILIGTPQFGTPFSIGAMLNGDGQTDVTGGLILYGGTVRKVSETLPAMYGLLPFPTYFSHDTDAPALFPDSTNNLFKTTYGSIVNSFSVLENFLTDSANILQNFPPNNLRTPIALSQQLLTKEIATHALLDTWSPPVGLLITSVVGWGNITPLQYLYTTSEKKHVIGFGPTYQVQHTIQNTESGDDTVVASSAIGDVADRFYFNAKAYASDNLGKIGHGNLTSAFPLQTLLDNLIEHKDTSVTYISTSTPSDGTYPLTVVSVHSPVNIVVTDSNGNQTGIFPVPGVPDVYYSKEDIPGSTLQILDDEKYAYLPPNNSYTISLQGYDDGDTTLDVGSMGKDGVPTTAVEYSDIPTTPNTKVHFAVKKISGAKTGITVPTTLQIDVNGNGITLPVRLHRILNDASIQNSDT